MPPRQVTPGVAAAQLVADVWQGATEGEAEQAMILEVDPSMSMVAELMMVTDVAPESILRSLPWREKKEEKKAQRKKKKRRETTKRPPQPKHWSERG